MKDVFVSGDVKSHDFQVSEDHLALFETGLVHSVCSTFVLAREIEWSSRLFVLEMCQENEEGVGTMLQIDHKSPAFVGDAVMIQAKVESLLRNELICSIEVKVGDRLIATGKTGQKIMSKERINQIFTSLD
ncbi:thioesterase family protein [Roseivirga sp.]|uniref:thioesterase family protein n=1 Tax=Roseivirga sp. TaxID=1964215 RepID=UPI003B8C8E86